VARLGIVVHGEVLRLAGIARAAGVAGLVCSGEEAASVHAVHGDALGLLVPGIRLTGGERHDQARVVTPAEAAARGARWIVVGRAVTGAADPRAAMAQVHRELAAS
jgi:orotidine-5'-phosphate decarboxylase